jgi:hypothetical protein
MPGAPAIETVLEDCVVHAIAEAGHFVSEVDTIFTHVRVKCSVSTYERVPVMSTFFMRCACLHPLKGVAQKA